MELFFKLEELLLLYIFVTFIEILSYFIVLIRFYILNISPLNWKNPIDLLIWDGILYRALKVLKWNIGYIIYGDLRFEKYFLKLTGEGISDLY